MVRLQIAELMIERSMISDHLAFRVCRSIALIAGLACGASMATLGQGNFTVTPGRIVTTEAAEVNGPQGVAYDGEGNLYIADALGHVVREISASGVESILAGTGIEGYSGDGGAASTAMLDTPTGVAIGLHGNVYIADSHNNCIREVVAGTINTIAGNGTAGYSGDGGPATAAQLWHPRAVAVDAGGTVYIADTGNQRIRAIAGSTIATIAGDGEELFSGDGGTATSAVLDSPTGVTVDAAGNVYIVDRHNQRIREISGATISTVAGGGAASFAGGFTGDGGVATSAKLSRPSGISVDRSGNLYIADTGNQRIREIGGGVIATIVGSGQQGFGGDDGTSVSVNLSAPKAVTTDAVGNLTFSDTLTPSLRSASLPTLNYASNGVGILSPAQIITLTNSGSGAMVVSSMTFIGPFVTAPGGSCAGFPVSLAANASCTEYVSFLPTSAGANSGSVVFGGAGTVPQTVLLVGAGAPSSTTLTLTSNAGSVLVGEPITFSAWARPAGNGTPTGTVSFFDGTIQIGTTQTLVNGVANLARTMSFAGLQDVSAVYSGEATTFLGSSSGVIAGGWVDFALSPILDQPGGATRTVSPGAAATYTFNFSPLGGSFNSSVNLSATGLPPGAFATFTPRSAAAGRMPDQFAMTIQTATQSTKLAGKGPFDTGIGGAALGLFLLPLVRRTSRKGKRIFSPLLFAVLVALAIAGGIAGCGTESRHETPQTYTVNVTGAATGTTGLVLVHSTLVTLTVE